MAEIFRLLALLTLSAYPETPNVATSHGYTRKTLEITRMQTQNSLSAVENWREFHKSTDGKRLFPGLESLRWFIRENRDSLIQAGALVKIRGQWHLVRPEFDDAVIRTLREKALTYLPH